MLEIVFSKNTTSSVLHFSHKTIEAEIYLCLQIHNDEATQFTIVIYFNVISREVLRENKWHGIGPHHAENPRAITFVEENWTFTRNV